ncbi:MAG: alpha/beta hydrolase [Bacteroidales bacterium]|nr:alpha/beta hydrolase [Bacteroidales bacterium]
MHKKTFWFLPLVFIATVTVISASVIQQKNNPCKKVKYVTAEPGTCLDPKAYRLLKAIDQVEQNPYNNEFAKRLIDIFEPRVRKTIDTIVTYSEHDVPVKIYYPTRKSLAEPTPVIFFIHGGGFMFGSIEEYDMAVKKLARISNKIVIAVDYRLAPKYPFPAALNDICAVFDWVIDNMESIGGKGNKIVVMGDSAGANLATVLALKSRDENKDNVLCQVLYYPPTTFVEKEFPSRMYFLRDDKRTYLITEEFLLESKRHYLGDSVDDRNPYASPLEADLTGDIPPAMIITAQVDPLRDDGSLYAEKLKESGQEVIYKEYEGIIHGFFNFYMVFRESKESMKMARDFIDDHFKNQPS